MLSEVRAKQFFEQMVNAVDYCHRRWASRWNFWGKVWHCTMTLLHLMSTHAKKRNLTSHGARLRSIT